MKLLIRFTSFFVLFACMHFAYAEGVEGLGALGGDINFGGTEPGTTLVLFPANPTPGETVEATLTSVNADVRSSLVTWTLNGKVMLSSRNADTFSFVAGNNGSRETLSATITPDAGASIVKTVSVVVSDVVLVWEARTYTPPFFKGRALQSPGSEIVLLALPNIKDPDGTTYDPAKLTYEWYTDSDPNPVFSGYGLQTVTLKNSNSFGAFRVTVKIKDKTGTQRALRNIDVPVESAEIVFYPDDPLLGIEYNNPFNTTYQLNGQSLTVVAEPYYLSVKKRTDQALTYAWAVGTQSLDTQGSITLRPEGKGSGASRIALTLTNTNEWEQRIYGDTLIQFTANTEKNSTTQTP